MLRARRFVPKARVDRARMRANGHGQLSTTRAREGLCVLALSRAS